MAQKTINSREHTKKVAKSHTVSETGEGTLRSPSSPEEGGRVPEPAQLLERISLLLPSATGVPKKGGHRFSYGTLLPTTKTHACSRRSVTISRRRSTSCRPSTVAKRGRSIAWPVRSVLPGRKGLFRVICAKDNSLPPTPTTTTTPVVILEAPMESSITGPAKALAITIHPYNREDVDSAQMLALPPTSSNIDSTLA